MKLCFVCNQEVLPEHKKMMIGLDKPYVNLWFHRDCYKPIESTLYQDLAQNPTLVYTYIENSGKIKVKGVKNEKN